MRARSLSSKLNLDFLLIENDAEGTLLCVWSEASSHQAESTNGHFEGGKKKKYLHKIGVVRNSPEKKINALMHPSCAFMTKHFVTVFAIRDTIRAEQEEEEEEEENATLLTSALYCTTHNAHARRTKSQHRRR